MEDQKEARSNFLGDAQEKINELKRYSESINKKWKL
jgi:hypothetical protein